eukprot:1788165-Pyramimonas_sp.AAC.1
MPPLAAPARVDPPPSRKLVLPPIASLNAQSRNHTFRMCNHTCNNAAATASPKTAPLARLQGFLSAALSGTRAACAYAGA